MDVKKNNIGWLTSFRWPVLYLGYVAIYLILLKHTPNGLSPVEQFLVSFLPLLMIALSIFIESLVPYKKEWRRPDINSANNILYMFINNYGESLTKAAALLLVVTLGRWMPVSSIEGLWPTQLPIIIQVVMGLLLYDFVYYWYHRISHQTEFLWRLHRLHHSSEKLTTLAGLKFNMFDIAIELFLLTFIMKIAGVPDNVFLIMVGIMTPATILSHANFKTGMPDAIAWLIITPDNHRIHHASNSAYYNKNFGGFTLLWDRVFRTYQPVGDIEITKTGIEGHYTSKWIWWQLLDFIAPRQKPVAGSENKIISIPSGQHTIGQGDISKTAGS